MEKTMSDNTGIEARYLVKKIEDPAGKHDDCFFFVLDPKHDKHAQMAMVAYALSVQGENPVLAQELEEVADRYYQEMLDE